MDPPQPGLAGNDEARSDPYAGQIDNVDDFVPQDPRHLGLSVGNVGCHSWPTGSPGDADRGDGQRLGDGDSLGMQWWQSGHLPRHDGGGQHDDLHCHGAGNLVQRDRSHERHFMVVHCKSGQPDRHIRSISRIQGSGRHTLQSNGFTPDGKVRSVSVGVLLRAAKAAKPSNAGATVYFAPLSSELSTEGKSTLNTLVKKVGAKTTATVVVGYVQGTTFTDNDTELSTERARVVARYLREQGVKGRTVRGEGVAPEAGAKARRVQVNIAYRS